MSNDSVQASTPQDTPESEWINKPLVIECDYHGSRHKQTFYSARDCSCDELRTKIKEYFKLTSRPFKVLWKDDYGEQKDILDEGTLDDAIQYHHSTDESPITMLVKVSPEYAGHSHSGAAPLVGKDADFVDIFQGSFARGEFSDPQQGVDAVKTISKADAGKSAQKSQLRMPHLLNSESCASSTDGGASAIGLLNGSTGAGGVTRSADPDDPVLVFENLKRQDLRNAAHLRSFKNDWPGAWAQNQGPDPLIEAHADSHSVFSGSESLNTDASLSDALLDPGIPPEIRLLRNYYPSSKSSEPAGDLEYEVPVDESQSNNDTGSTRKPRLPQEGNRCSECDCVLEWIKYTCTTCGEEPPMSGAAAAAKGKGRNREPSTSPTILGRNLGSSDPIPRVGYELCAACFEKVGVDHSWASCVNGTFTTPQELSKARRSPPKQKGQLRHAFVERVRDGHCWENLGQGEMSCECSICGAKLSESADRYKCGVCKDITICRGCFGNVHNVDPTHPFLDMRVQPASESQTHDVEVSNDITVAEDDEDDSPSTRVQYPCSYCEQEIVGTRMRCTICEGNFELCSNCDDAGVSGSPDSGSGHSSSHVMLKIPVQDPVEQAHGESHDQNPPESLDNTVSMLDTEDNFIHSQSCDSCGETIVGVRYQCLNCPSIPTSFNLCSDCEVNSYKDHHPMHVFLKIPRRVDVPGPLESDFPLLPIVYRSPAGPGRSSPTPNDPEAYLRKLTHTFALCDSHTGRIVGKWYRCAFCSKDLCADCEELDAHDRTHAFLVFKAPVDESTFRPLAESGKLGCQPLLHGTFYHAQHN